MDFNHGVMDMMNKAVMITGAAHGIGSRLARDCLDQGAKVIACDIDMPRLGDLFSSLDKCVIRELDVRRPEQWEALVESLDGGLDYMINVAGVIRPDYLWETELSDIDLQIDVNLKGTIYGTKYAADLMRRSNGRRKGHIINISSMAGLAPVSGIGIYTASKFGVRGFSLAMAQELGGEGIKVSVVVPDAVDTGMLDDQMDSEAAALTFSGSRILTVGEVSRAVFKEVIKGGKTEAWIPSSRGVLACLGGMFPELASYLTKRLREKGLKQQEQFRRERRKS